MRIKHLITNKLLIILILLFSTLSLSAVINRPVLADTAKDAVCEGAGATDPANPTDCTGGLDLNTIIKFVLNILSIIVGITAVVMIIIAGFKFITSNGDSNNVASAKNTILYAIVGLVIVAFAQIIVKFVLNKASQASKPKTTTIMRTVEINKEFMV